MDNSRITSSTDPRLAGIPDDFVSGGFTKEWLVRNRQHDFYTRMYEDYRRQNPGYNPKLPEPPPEPPKNNPPASYVKPSNYIKPKYEVRDLQNVLPPAAGYMDNDRITKMLENQDEKVLSHIWNTIYQIEDEDIGPSNFEAIALSAERDPRFENKMPEKSKGWWWKKQKKPFDPSKYPQLYDRYAGLKPERDKAIENLTKSIQSVREIHPKLQTLIKYGNKALNHYLSGFEEELRTIYTDSVVLKRDIEKAEEQMAKEHLERNKEQYELDEGGGFWSLFKNLIPKDENIHFDEEDFASYELQEKINKTKTPKVLKYEKRIGEIIDELTETGVLEMIQQIRDTDYHNIIHLQEYDMKRKKLYAKIIEGLSMSNLEMSMKFQDHVMSSQEILLQNLKDERTIHEETELYQAALESVWGKDPKPEGADHDLWLQQRKEVRDIVAFDTKEEAAMGEEIAKYTAAERAQYYDKKDILALLFNPNYPKSIANLFTRHKDEFLAEMEDTYDPYYVNRLVSLLKHSTGFLSDLLPQLTSLVPGLGYTKMTIDTFTNIAYKIFRSRTIARIGDWAAPKIKKTMGFLWSLGMQIGFSYWLVGNFSGMSSILIALMLNVTDKYAIHALKKLYELHPLYEPKYLDKAINFVDQSNSNKLKYLKSVGEAAHGKLKGAISSISSIPGSIPDLANDFLEFSQELDKNKPEVGLISTKGYTRHKQGDVEILDLLSKGTEPDSINEKAIFNKVRGPRRRTFRISDFAKVPDQPAQEPGKQVITRKEAKNKPGGFSDFEDMAKHKFKSARTSLEPKTKIPYVDVEELELDDSEALETLYGNINEITDNDDMDPFSVPSRSAPAPVAAPPQDTEMVDDFNETPEQTEFQIYDFIEHAYNQGLFDVEFDELLAQEPSPETHEKITTATANAIIQSLQFGDDVEGLPTIEDIQAMVAEMPPEDFELLQAGSDIQPDETVTNPPRNPSHKEALKKKKEAIEKEKLGYQKFKVNQEMRSMITEELSTYLNERNPRIRSVKKAFEDVFKDLKINDKYLNLYGYPTDFDKDKNKGIISQLSQKANKEAKAELLEFLKVRGDKIPTAEMMGEQAETLNRLARKSIHKQLALETQFQKVEGEKQKSEINKKIQTAVKDKMKYLYQLSFFTNIEQTFKNNHYEVTKDAERSARFMDEFQWYYERVNSHTKGKFHIDDYEQFHKQNAGRYGDTPGLGYFQFLPLLKDIHQKDSEYRKKHNGEKMPIPFSMVAKHLEYFRNKEAQEWVDKKGQAVNLFSMVPNTKEFGTYLNTRDSPNDSVFGNILEFGNRLTQWGIGKIIPEKWKKQSYTRSVFGVPYAAASAMTAYGITTSALNFPGVQSILLTHLTADGILVPITENLFAESFMEMTKKQKEVEKVKFQMDDRIFQRQKRLMTQYREKQHRDLAALNSKLLNNRKGSDLSRRIYKQTQGRLRKAGGASQVSKLQQAENRFIVEQVQFEEKEKDILAEIEAVKNRQYGEDSMPEFMAEYDEEGNKAQKELMSLDTKLKIIQHVKSIPSYVSMATMAYMYYKINVDPRSQGTERDHSGREIDKFQKGVYQLEAGEAAIDDYFGIDAEAVKDVDDRMALMRQLLRKRVNEPPPVPPESMTFETSTEFISNELRTFVTDTIDKEMVLVDVATGQIIHNPGKHLMLYFHIMEKVIEPETSQILNLNKPFRFFPDTEKVKELFDPGYTPGKVSIFDEQIQSSKGVWSSKLDDLTVRLMPKAYAEQLDMFKSQFTGKEPSIEFQQFLKKVSDPTQEFIAAQSLSRFDKMQLQFMISSPLGSLSNIIPPKDNVLFEMLGGNISGPTESNLLYNHNTIDKFSGNSGSDILTNLLSGPKAANIPHRDFYLDAVGEGKPWTMTELANMKLIDYNALADALKKRYSVGFLRTQEGARSVFKFMNSPRSHQNIIAFLRRQQALENATYFQYGMAWLMFAKSWLYANVEYTLLSTWSGAKLGYNAFTHNMGWGEGRDGMMAQMNALLSIKEKLENLLNESAPGESVERSKPDSERPRIHVEGFSQPSTFKIETTELSKSDKAYLELWKQATDALAISNPALANFLTEEAYKDILSGYQTKQQYTKKILGDVAGSYKSISEENAALVSLMATKEITAICHDLGNKVFGQGVFFYLKTHSEVTSALLSPFTRAMEGITGGRHEHTANASPVFNLVTSVGYWVIEESIMKTILLGQDLSEQVNNTGKSMSEIYLKDLIDPDSGSVQDIAASPYYDFSDIHKPRIADPVLKAIFYTLNYFHEASVNLAELSPDSKTVYGAVKGAQIAADASVVAYTKATEEVAKAAVVVNKAYNVTAGYINKAIQYLPAPAPEHYQQPLNTTDSPSMNPFDYWKAIPAGIAGYVSRHSGNILKGEQRYDTKTLPDGTHVFGGYDRDYRYVYKTADEWSNPLDYYHSYRGITPDFWNDPDIYYEGYSLTKGWLNITTGEWVKEHRSKPWLTDTRYDFKDVQPRGLPPLLQLGTGKITTEKHGDITFENRDVYYSRSSSQTPSLSLSPTYTPTPTPTRTLEPVRNAMTVSTVKSLVSQIPTITPMETPRFVQPPPIAPVTPSSSLSKTTTLIPTQTKMPSYTPSSTFLPQSSVLPYPPKETPTESPTPLPYHLPQPAPDPHASITPYPFKPTRTPYPISESPSQPQQKPHTSIAPYPINPNTSPMPRNPFIPYPSTATPEPLIPGPAEQRLLESLTVDLQTNDYLNTVIAPPSDVKYSNTTLLEEEEQQRPYEFSSKKKKKF